MRDRNSRHHSPIRITTLMLLALSLWGCAGNQQPDEQPTPPPPTEQQPENEQEASRILPPSQYSNQFNLAEQSLASFDWMETSIILAQIPSRSLSANDHAVLTYLQARIVFIRGDQQQALELLENLQGPEIDSAIRYRVSSFQHHILELAGDYSKSAQLADQILRMAPRDTRPAWKRNIWLNLQREDQATLQAALFSSTNPQWRGWLELAVIAQSNSHNLSGELAVWRDNNREHPAANPLPGGLSPYPAPALGQTALILPLSGQLSAAGKAVMEGYLAAYYSARQSGNSPQSLMILDLDKYPSANAAYDKALQQGASLVVGPLSKQAVADLATRPERTIPVLALNRIEQVLPASGSAFIQLSLAPEDEANRLAELAFGQGARSALIISPAGEWGSKVEDALRARWATLGGSVVSNVTYADREEYSGALKSALGLADSEQRGRDIRDMLATNIEVTPRRRMDPDVVFLLSRNGAEARSIMPLLAFHYAGALPVYATSSIYNGLPDDRNRDLEGITMIDIPWLLGADTDLRDTIAAGDTGSASFTRLNALGADAFLLQTNLSRLQSGADALFRGNTGLLSMDPGLRIHRELSPAIFDKGTLKPR